MLQQSNSAHQSFNRARAASAVEMPERALSLCELLMGNPCARCAATKIACKEWIIIHNRIFSQRYDEMNDFLPLLIFGWAVSSPASQLMVWWKCYFCIILNGVIMLIEWNLYCSMSSMEIPWIIEMTDANFPMHENAVRLCQNGFCADSGHSWERIKAYECRFN